MINVMLSAGDLCGLMNGRFTHEACEAICQFMEDNDQPGPFRIGDIAISFCEVPASYESDYTEDEIIARLENGNILVLE